MTAILAKKLGMTQRFQEDGKVERVTVLEAGPCPVTGIRTVTTGHGPASITVTASTLPVSWSKTCVIPSFLPRIPFIAIRA